MSQVDLPLIFPLQQRLEWRADPQAITLLKSIRENQLAAKQWISGQEKPISYALIAEWHPFVALAQGIESLSAILSRAALHPRLTVVRGAVREESAHKPTINRRVHASECRLPPDMTDVPRFSLMLDLDGVPEPIHFDWLADPRRAAIWAAGQYLPTSFKNCGFHYQYSASAGIKPGLRLHFWFWLEEAMNSSDVKRRLRAIGNGQLDLSLYNPVQPHYTANPVFIGMKDPLSGKREGLVL